MLQNEIWFVFGMCIDSFHFKVNNRIKAGIAIGTLFLVLSIITYDHANALISFLLGCTACIAVIFITAGIKKNKVMNFLARYTMPIFLMHTLFAAPLRVILMRLGLDNPFIQVTIGILASVLGPIIAMKIMEKIKPLDFVVYPGRYIRL